MLAARLLLESDLEAPLLFSLTSFERPFETDLEFDLLAGPLPPLSLPRLSSLLLSTLSSLSPPLSRSLLSSLLPPDLDLDLLLLTFVILFYLTLTCTL